MLTKPKSKRIVTGRGWATHHMSENIENWHQVSRGLGCQYQFQKIVPVRIVGEADYRKLLAAARKGEHVKTKR